MEHVEQEVLHCFVGISSFHAFPVMERPIRIMFSTDILRRAIEQRLDRRAYEKVLRQERKIRRELSQRLSR
jgi:hypothetical protein